MSVLAGLPTVPEVRGPAARVLERVALALSSTLELREVLHLLAEAGLDATGAGGTAVLLLQERRLVPATVVRRIEDDTLQERFHTMPPIELDGDRWLLLQAGRAIVFEDARSSELLPTELVERFSLRGFALVPLLAAGEPYGVMCVDWDEVRSFTKHDIAVLEAFGAYAGMAVRNARLYETMRRRARLQEELARSAAALARRLEPARIAGRLADAYIDLLDARLCAVLLFERDQDTVQAIASRGFTVRPELVRISDLPQDVVGRIAEAWRLHREPVAILDRPELAAEVGGRESGATWYLFLPLVTDGRTRGAVALGFAPGTVLDDQERSAADALADIAAAALERHALLERLDRQLGQRDALYETSAALNSSTSLPPVLDLVCDGFRTLLGASHSSVNLFGSRDPDLLSTLAHAGIAWFAGRPGSVGAVSRAEVARLRAAWRDAPPDAVVYDEVDERLAVEPLVVPAAVRSAVIFPLVHAGETFGVVVAGFPELGAVGGEDLETGRTLASLAATAIDRARLDAALRLRLRQVEALNSLSDVVAGSLDLEAAITELNRRFEPELGVTFGSIAIANGEVRDLLGARAPDDEDMEAIRSWRAVLAKGANAPRPRPGASGLLVPVVHRARVFGSLRVSCADCDVEPSVEDLLVAIGAGCGEVAYKAGLHRALADRERRLTVASERERIARDLHDSVGQVLAGMGMLVSQYAGEAPDEQWRVRMSQLLELTRQGAREVRDSVYSLLFLQTRQAGLVASLRELTRKFEAMTGLPVSFRVEGDPDELSLAREDALFRTAHEALMNVDRHACGSSANVTLQYLATEVRIVIADDGIGFAPPSDGGHHFGLIGLERRLDEVGGELRCRPGPGGTGTVLEGSVPRKTRTRP